ncbi:Oidioi.mRNA.OKI2018_I69.PAR.g11970.t2.cds [Oikopleura dioica]|uniref:Oidioi.mRNA.OKI2018_I69.PAR.g11970.t2.cds n=1 Tax=Oikopleura dioica TaxID=34765 RepID=A0ABN7RYJ7_OIKDI|nr:Oidioi.mRNA.OKI2018_I69.PAR.g11970.t2.cds [Oikopleura dioica]
MPTFEHLEDKDAGYCSFTERRGQILVIISLAFPISFYFSRKQGQKNIHKLSIEKYSLSNKDDDKRTKFNNFFEFNNNSCECQLNFLIDRVDYDIDVIKQHHSFRFYNSNEPYFHRRNRYYRYIFQTEAPGLDYTVEHHHVAKILGIIVATVVIYKLIKKFFRRRTIKYRSHFDDQSEDEVYQTRAH